MKIVGTRTAVGVSQCGGGVPEGTVTALQGEAPFFPGYECNNPSRANRF